MSERTYTIGLKPHGEIGWWVGDAAYPDKLSATEAALVLSRGVTAGLGFAVDAGLFEDGSLVTVLDGRLVGFYDLG